MKSFWWKCQTNNASDECKKRSEEGKSQRSGEQAAPEMRWISSPLWEGVQADGAAWQSPASGSWCHAWKSGESSLSWGKRFVPLSALPTQKIAYSTLSVKLWRLPFMDLEISLMLPPLLAKHGYFPGAKDR